MHLATATGTPDSSGSNLRLAHSCRMNAAFRLGADCNLVTATTCARVSTRADFPFSFLSIDPTILYSPNRYIHERPTSCRSQMCLRRLFRGAGFALLGATLRT